jgi:mycothiol synthase
MARIVVRAATSDADLEAWRRVRLAVLPGERASTVEEMRAALTPEIRCVLAELDGAVVGSGLAGRSSFDYAGLHPRVVPDARRRGVGTAILADLAAHAEAVGFTEAGSQVEDPGALRFAERFGLREVDRQVEQLRTIDIEPWPAIPLGIEIVTVADRPDLWDAAFDRVALHAFEDMVTVRPIVVSRAQWDRDWRPSPEALFLAVADGEVIGISGLELDPDRPARAEHAITAVARAWRRRGIATLLKRCALAYGADHGVREVVTWTQAGNAEMQALNARLGYRDGGVSVTVRGPLPLTGPLVSR